MTRQMPRLRALALALGMALGCADDAGQAPPDAWSAPDAAPEGVAERGPERRDVGGDLPDAAAERQAEAVVDRLTPDGPGDAAPDGPGDAAPDGAGDAAPDGVGDAALDRPVGPPLDDDLDAGGVRDGAPGDTLGTPVIDDDGAGPARVAAGYYRLGVQAWRGGLSFPADRRTVIDFYVSSALEVFSNGLGGKLTRRPARGPGAVFAADFGADLELVLDHAEVAPHLFMRAVLWERGLRGGQEDRFPYPGVVNRIADPPFAGGPTEALPPGYVPPFFALAVGQHSLRCTGSSVPLDPADAGAGAAFTPGRAYVLTVVNDGTLQLETDGAPLVRAWDEARDTHAWPTPTGLTSVRLNGQGGTSVTAVVLDPAAPARLTVEQQTSGPTTFATYTLAGP